MAMTLDPPLVCEACGETYTEEDHPLRCRRASELVCDLCTGSPVVRCYPTGEFVWHDGAPAHGPWLGHQDCPRVCRSNGWGAPWEYRRPTDVDKRRIKAAVSAGLLP